MKHDRLLLAAFVTAALISAPTAMSAAGLAAAGLPPVAPASDVQLVHDYPFRHCHACGNRPVYICHTVGPTPICPPSTRVYRPQRRPH